MSQNDNSNSPEVSKKEATETVEETRNLSRRKMFGSGFMGFAAVLATACSGTDFASSGANGRKKSAKSGSDGNDGFGESDGQDGLNSSDGPDGQDSGESDGGGIDGADGGADGTDGNLTDLTECNAYSTNKIDTTGMPELAEKPTIKFYGRTDSALVAMKFDGALGIDQVIIATPSGKILALHGITGADKKGAEFRPIVVDNIWLKEKGADITEVYIILQSGNERKLHKEPVAFFTTYNSTPVKDLSGRAVPASWMANQSVTQFAQVDGSYNSDATVTYPNDFNSTATRNLQTVRATSTWTKGAGIKGTVTDIMGETIDITGAAIIEHQIFCTYVVAGGFAYRTILHIG